MYCSDVIDPVRDRLEVADRHRICLIEHFPSTSPGWRRSRRMTASRSSGARVFLDGTVGSRTARLLEHWADRTDSRGMWLELAAEGRLEEWQQLVHAAGLDTSVHAIGDEAVSLALDLHARSEGEQRCVIEHAQIIRDEDLPRTAGALLSMQPLHRAEDARVALDALGPGRTPLECCR